MQMKLYGCIFEKSDEIYLERERRGKCYNSQGTFINYQDAKKESVSLPMASAIVFTSTEKLHKKNYFITGAVENDDCLLNKTNIDE